ncbi:MAG: solute:sodium symporter family transporter [Cyclobacteriaceae bacterium]|nr:MAG: solute:sodium symporter family transporter [Cyclobacteriaceae bacterium]
MLSILSFIAFTAFVGIYSWYKLRNDQLDSREGYFLGGRSLTGVVIAGSMLLTNISTEHLIGMNGSSYKNGFVIISWEVTSALALVVAANYFIPTFIKMRLTTIPQYLEERYDGTTRTLVALFLLVSFVVTLLPIVLYTGAINLESIFSISERLDVSKSAGLWITVICIGLVGSAYAIFGGLKAVAHSDTVNGVGLFIGGLMIPIIALWDIGHGNIIAGLSRVYQNSPEKFNVIGAADSVLPFGTLFTGLVINQLYFWGMNQTIIQRAFGAKSLAEAQKGLLYTGVLKILIPIIIVLPGVIGYYYFGDALYQQQDMIYPELIKKLLPAGLVGFFAAVVMGAVLSTFNSVLNSTATIFSEGIYKRLISRQATDKQMVNAGKFVSVILAILAILAAPMVAGAPEGLYQLLQQLNGIFFIPIASIMLAGLFIPWVTARAAKIALLFGLSFYIFCTFIFDVNIHFVHIWGIEFVLNIAIMLAISRFYKDSVSVLKKPIIQYQQVPWKYTRSMSAVLVVIILLIYWWLGAG